MGTRSTIAIQNEDGTVTGIYCHWDGYLSHNGRILEENYTTEESVRELIDLGDLSSLGETIGTKHDFNAAPRNECNAYGRDRGEINIDAQTCASWSALINDFGQEYDYLFVPGKGWLVRYFEGRSTAELPLAEALEQDAVTDKI
jgi:hypothetical protein